MADVADGDGDEDALFTLEAKGGSLSVYETHVEIERASKSMFEDKHIAFTDVLDVIVSSGISTGYIQIHQRDVEPDSGGFLSPPMDENTFHFSRKQRETADAIYDAILERID